MDGRADPTDGGQDEEDAMEGQWRKRNMPGLALAIVLGACGGGGSSSPVGTGAEAGGPGSTPVSTPVPAPSPVAAPAPDPSPAPGTGPVPAPPPGPGAAGGPPPLPIEGDDGVVRWAAAYSPIDADLALVVEPFASVPAATNGRPEGLNVLAHGGGHLVVGAELSGRLYRIAAGQPTTLWFDLASALPRHGRRLDTTENLESGLRSIAFHPDFAANGRFYLSALVGRPADTTGLHYLSDGSGIGVDSLVMEWTADPTTMGVDPDSFREVFRVGLPYYDHPLKQIAFGPDRLLYIAHGDGSESTAAAGGGVHRSNALGKILRIDPLATAGAPYSIPSDNPLVGQPGAVAEIFSLGHRNPHHLAFLPDGTLVVAEPGSANLDEINLIEKGGNHGWSAREGTYVHRTSGGLLGSIATLPDDDAGNGYVYPAVQFGHPGPRGSGSTGHALGGGYVVSNGSALDGRYFYCEFATSGELYFATVEALQTTVRKGPPAALTQARMLRARLLFDHDGDPATPAQPRSSMVDVVDDSPTYDGSGRADIRFGQGPDGTLYLMSKRNGLVYRVANSQPGAR